MNNGLSVEVKRGAVGCELNDLSKAVVELEAVIEPLAHRLSPILNHSESVPMPSRPEPPEPSLPEMGEQIRCARKSVGRCIGVLSDLQRRIEI